MGYQSEDIGQLLRDQISRIFTTTFHAWLTQEELFFLRPKFQEVEKNIFQSGHPNRHGITCTSDTELESYVKDYMEGTPGLTDDEEQNNMTIKGLNGGLLTTNQIIELLQRGLTIELVHAKDYVTVYDDIEAYLAIIHRQKMYNLHYRPPSAEDMEKMNLTLRVFAPLVEKIRDGLDEESTSWREFARLGASINSSFRDPAREKIDQFRNTQREKLEALNNPNKGSKSVNPYDIFFQGYV